MILHKKNEISYSTFLTIHYYIDIIPYFVIFFKPFEQYIARSPKQMFQTSSLSFDRYLIKFLYVLSKISTQLLSILFATNNSLNCFIVEYL